MQEQPRVVEWGSGIAAGYAAKMLRGVGAPTSRVIDEGAERDLHRDGSAPVAAYLDAGKTVHVLDLRREEGRERFLSLVANADVLIEDQVPPYKSACRLDIADLSAANPRLIVVSVTPFGVRGPYRNYRGNDAVVSFMAGLAYLTPRDIEKAGSDVEQPPLKMPGSLVSIYAGISAACATLTALRLRERTGHGHHVDVSMLESLIPTLRREIALYRYEGVVASRFMRVWKLAPWGVKRCKDGFVFLQVVEKHHWLGLVEMLGTPSWARDERYHESEYRYEHRRDIEEKLRPWLLEHTRSEIEREAQRRSVPFIGVNEVRDLLGIPQLRYRQFFYRDLSSSAAERWFPREPWQLTHAVRNECETQSTAILHDL